MQSRRSRSYSILFMCAVFLFAEGCGRKAPPVPLAAINPEAIKDLHGEMVGERIRLRWSIPTRSGAPLDGIEGFQVFRFQSNDPNTLCNGCPIPFKAHVFIKADLPDVARIDGSRVVYDDPVDPAMGYAYKVVTHHSSGGRSDDSNVFLILPRGK